MPSGAAPCGPAVDDQGLHLDEQRTVAVERRHDDRAGTPPRRSARNSAARVGHADEAALGHLEQPELVGGAEPVLHRAQQPEGVVPVALEREHGVDDVLEHPGAGERAVLGDVADEHRGDAAFAS